MLRDRAVLTGGIREDDYKARTTSVGATVDPNTGFYTYGQMNEWSPRTYASRPTRFLSAVVYPFKNRRLGLTFSRASSFQPQPKAVDLLGMDLTNTYERGRDYGVVMN